MRTKANENVKKNGKIILGKGENSLYKHSLYARSFLPLLDKHLKTDSKHTILMKKIALQRLMRVISVLFYIYIYIYIYI